MGAIGIWKNVGAFTLLYQTQPGKLVWYSGQNPFQMTYSGAILDQLRRGQINDLSFRMYVLTDVECLI